MTYLLLQITILLYFYVLGMILTEKIAECLELFVLRTGYDKAVALLKHEPHYPWYLACVRHIFLFIALLITVSFIDLDAKSSFFLPQIIFVFGVLVVMSYIAALFWSITSLRIDKIFHTKQTEKLKKNVCEVRTHILSSPKRHQQASVTLFLFSLFLILTSGIFWTLLWKGAV